MTKTRMYRIAISEVKRQYPDISPEQLDEEVELLVDEWLSSADYPEDSPCIESGRDNCDDWGTGEGAYHGRM